MASETPPLPTQIPLIIRHAAHFPCIAHGPLEALRVSRSDSEYWLAASHVRQASVRRFRIVLQERPDALLGHDPLKLVKGRLVRWERLIPDRRAVFLVDHFKDPAVLIFATVNQHLDGRVVLADFSAKRGVDDVGLVIHGRCLSWLLPWCMVPDEIVKPQVLLTALRPIG